MHHVLRAARLGLLLVLPTILSAQGVAHRLVPELRINAATEDLGNIRNIAVSPRGTIAVGQESDFRILFYDAAGKRLGAIGRRGGGPTEFERMGMFGWSGDTLWVANAIIGIKLITPQFAVGRSIPMTNQIVANRPELLHSGPPAPLVRFGDGSRLVMTYFSYDLGVPSWAGRPYPGSNAAILRLSATDNLQKVIAWIPPTAGCDGTFCANPLSGVAPGGRSVAFLIPAADGQPQFRFVVISLQGDTLIARDYPFQPLRIPQHAIDSVIASQRPPPDSGMARRPVPADPPPGTSTITAPEPKPQPGYYPAASRILANRDGTFWIQLRPVGANATWRLLNARGEMTGTLTIPTTIDVRDVNGNTVWGIEKDEDDLQSVVRYRLVR